MRKLLAILITLLSSASTTGLRAESTTAALIVPKPVNAAFAKHCISCHGAESSEGNVRFDTLSTLSKTARLQLLNKAQAQLFFGMMPPQAAEKPPTKDRMLLAGWIRSELRKSNASELDKKMRAPGYGNYVDHNKLFSGEINAKAFTPARRWLVSPQIFEQRVLDIFNVTGRERNGLKQRGFYGVTNPFVLPENSGVRYFDQTTLDGGHVLAMLGNAEWISHKQIMAARIKNKDNVTNTNKRDRWYPKVSPAAFEKIVLKKSQPSDEELITAIQTQFDCVLRRKANDEELKKYVDFTRISIEKGGNTEGLRRMLVSVLLESEFLYRLEFGAGPVDQHGRKKLSPREASDAIAYALGDSNPDSVLIKAVAQGRLTTKADYKREVQRLLDSKTLLAGQIDKTLNGKHLSSHVATHPKLVRFFREFFGYPQALKVFKDINRSDGVYHNPGRGTAATPGFLVDEADKLVSYYLQKDRNVFENLLTTEKFFVYDYYDRKKSKQIIGDWKTVYKKLKDIDWRKNPEKVAQEHRQFLKKHRIDMKPGRRHTTTLTRLMEHLSFTLGNGRTPFPKLPWAHGYVHLYSPIYNLGRSPGAGGRYRAEDTFDFQIEQPFIIANRKGLLTHPAWLIAHSQNTETDPVRRGKWIREKLLAGRVPNVPITVDAQIPENPHQTLRERLDSVTTKQACWKCHRHMNPLGLAFEMYDDFGRHRSKESLEHPENLIRRATNKNGADTYKTKALVTKGYLSGTGDKTLDGEVKDAIDLVQRLAKSARVRQSIIRHAFRYFLGRNEMLSDSQTLIDADKAYVQSGGSFNAVIVSLLTSDSFMYRKTIRN